MRDLYENSGKIQQKTLERKTLTSFPQIIAELCLAKVKDLIME